MPRDKDDLDFEDGPPKKKARNRDDDFDDHDDEPRAKRSLSNRDRFDDDDYDDDSAEFERREKTALKDAAGKKMAAGLCGILIGALGIHKFIYGANGAGLTMLLISILTCGIGAGVMGIIGLIEGIIYLTKSDEDFYELYMLDKKAWF